MDQYLDDLDEIKRQQLAASDPLGSAIKSDMPKYGMSDMDYQVPPPKPRATRPEVIDDSVLGAGQGVMAGMNAGVQDLPAQDDVSDLVKRTIATRSSAGEKYNQDMSAARGLSNNQNLMANLGDASSGLGYAIAGVERPKTNFYDNERAQAAAIPGQVQEDLKGQGDALKNSVTADLNDPSSTRSQVFKNIFLKTWGEKVGVTQDDLKNMSAADVGDLEKILSAKAGVDLKETIAQQNAAMRGSAFNFRDSQLDKRFQNSAFKDVMGKLTTDKQLQKSLGQAKNLEFALDLINKSDKLTPEQIREFQYAIRSNLNIQGSGGVGEREATTLNSMGLKAEAFKEFLTGDPAEIAKDNKIVTHLRQLANNQIANVRAFSNDRIDAVKAGYEDVFANNPQYTHALEKKIAALGKQFTTSLPASSSGLTPDEESRRQELLRKKGNQ